MRHFLLCSVLSLVIFQAAPATAQDVDETQVSRTTEGGGRNTTVFPPLHCGDDPNHEMLLTWKDGAANTNCRTIQKVLKDSITPCADGQVITYDGGRFICDDSDAGGKPCPASNATDGGYGGVPLPAGPGTQNRNPPNTTLPHAYVAMLGNYQQGGGDHTGNYHSYSFLQCMNGRWRGMGAFSIRSPQ